MISNSLGPILRKASPNPFSVGQLVFSSVVDLGYKRPSWKIRLSSHFRPPSRLTCPNWCGNSPNPLLRQEVDASDVRIPIAEQVGYWKAQHARQCVAPSTSKPRSNNFAVRTGSSRINSSVEKVKKLRPGIAPTLEGKNHDRDSSPRQRGQRKNRPGPRRRHYSRLPASRISASCPRTNAFAPRRGGALPSDTEDSEQN